MSKILVAYFSASEVTTKLAKNLAETVDGDIFCIEPEVPYTKEDLDWKASDSRSLREMEDKTFRPAIKTRCENISDYDIVFLGFPIWWFTAPSIINTFLESYDFTGKTIIPFATSDISGMGKTKENLIESCKGANLLTGKVFENTVSKETLSAWAQEFLQ